MSPSGASGRGKFFAIGAERWYLLSVIRVMNRLLIQWLRREVSISLSRYQIFPDFSVAQVLRGPMCSGWPIILAAGAMHGLNVDETPSISNKHALPLPVGIPRRSKRFQ